MEDTGTDACRIECEVDDAALEHSRAFGPVAPWPLGIVPWAIEGDDGRGLRAKAARAMAAWSEAVPGLRFVERVSERGYVAWTNQGRCVASSVGYSGQRVRLGVAGCGVDGAIHEMGHALGLHHEHTRPDRDDYIVVHTDRIEPGAKGQFTKRNGRPWGPFDWRSIMLYSRGAFSATGQETMTPIDPANARLWRRDGISALDAAGVMELHRQEIAKRDPPPVDPPVDPPSPPAVERVLRLHDRFEARAAWRTAEANGRGQVVAATDESGVFAFWDAAGWELLVTVRDGREINGRWWVTAACASDQAWWLTIVDTETGARWEAANPPGERSRAVVDIEAF